MIGDLARGLGLPYATVLVTLGVSLLGASVGLIGCFAVLRRRALTGDALAHAALPGVCIGFMLVGERSLPWLLAGAFVAGLLGVQIISALHRFTRVKEDAAIGLVLSVFYGLGIVLLTVIQQQFAGASRAGLDHYILGQAANMRQVEVELIAGASAVSLLVMLVLYKEFRLISFDPGFARVQGWPALLLDSLLMALVALAVAVGLPAVGVVMIAALLILPGVTARFWTDRLGRMLLLAACIGAATGFLGAALSARYSLLPAGPIIVLVGSGFFIVSAAAAPRRGVLGRLVAEWRFRREVAMRNLMRLLYERVEANPARGSTVAELESARAWSSGQLASLLLAAARQGWTHLDPAGAIGLTEAGLRRGAEIARGYRLWQLFLTEYPDQATGLVNLADESAATALPQELVAALTAKLQRAGRWPPLPAAPEETP